MQMSVKSQTQGMEHGMNMAEIAARGTARLFDIQAALMRGILERQARRMAMFGWPDYSQFFRALNGESTKLFETSVEQMLSTARETNSKISEMQGQFGELVQKQTEQLVNDMRQGAEELRQQTREGMDEYSRLAQRELDEIRHTVDQAQQAAQDQQDQSQDKGVSSEQEGRERLAA